MFDCILLMAGAGKRSNLEFNKIEYKINGKALYQYSLDEFMKIKDLNKIIMVVRADEYARFKSFQSDKIIVTCGGARRQDSVLCGLKKCQEELVMIHDAARCNVKVRDIEQLYYKGMKSYAAYLGVLCTDALRKKNGKSLDRNNIFIVQTPQMINKAMLQKALEEIKVDVYDDIEAIEKVYGIAGKVVLGSYDNIKVTTPADLKYMEYLKNHEN